MRTPRGGGNLMKLAFKDGKLPDRNFAEFVFGVLTDEEYAELVSLRNVLQAKRRAEFWLGPCGWRNVKQVIEQSEPGAL